MSATAAPSTGPIRPDTVQPSPDPLGHQRVGIACSSPRSRSARPAARRVHPVVRRLARRPARAVEGQQARAGTGRARCAGRPARAGRPPPPNPARGRRRPRPARSPSQPWSAIARHRLSSKGRPECQVRPHLVVAGAVVEQTAGRRPAEPPDPPRVRSPSRVMVGRTPCAKLNSWTSAPHREQEAFRADIRAWLVGQPPVGVRPGPAAAVRRPRRGGGIPAHLAGARWPRGGWVGVAWPESYGGRGRRTGRALHRPRGAGPGPGPRDGGPDRAQPGRPHAAGLRHRASSRRAGSRGSARPRTSGASCSASPGRGATWPSLRTRADRVEGGWLVNGQKVWTSYAQFADWGVCLARSDPEAAKHKGISYLVIDMHHPGVEVRPLVQLTGEAEFNEVFLSDVFVPEDQLIGPEHEGWRVANSTLSHERGTNPRQLVIHMQLLEELLRLAEENGAFDDRATARGAGAGLRGDPPVPAAQSAQREPALARARARPRGQRAQAVLERDVQALPRDGHGRAG